MAPKTKYLLISIFLLALGLRFLFFPGNTYFGYDQARDAFATQEILSGQLKVIGPPTTFEGLNHGVLYYYIYAPFYLLGNGDPTVVSAFLRVVNAAGIFLVFLIGAILFNRYVGLIAALLFAFSFEQTQFALYLNHPSLAVFSILIFILGLALLIFKNQKRGLILASLGLGLSIQFEFILTYLGAIFIMMLIYFRKEIKLDFKTVTISAIIFLASVSTFIISELKFNFRSLTALPNLLGGSEKSIENIIGGYLHAVSHIIKFNFTGSLQFNFLFAILLAVFLKLLFSKLNKQISFLGIWFFSLFIIYIVNGGGDFFSGTVQYHPNVGVSVGLIIFVSYLIYRLYLKSRILSVIVVLLIIFINLSMIFKINPSGSMPEINAQSFMIISLEKQVLDFIYKDAAGEPFAVKAITMPFYINTTWSYLFEWYGMQKYGYLPIWGGKNALGYGGNLVVEDAQDKLPPKRYLIVEPTRGIPNRLIDEYLRIEGYFTDLVQEKEIGDFKVQVRVKK